MKQPSPYGANIFNLSRDNRQLQKSSTCKIVHLQIRSQNRQPAKSVKMQNYSLTKSLEIRQLSGGDQRVVADPATRPLRQQLATKYRVTPVHLLHESHQSVNLQREHRQLIA